MIFLNYIMLAGLAAVAIPIIIHLLNRKKARLVEWGAMRFLLASLAARRSRILLEEIILLAIRCLMLALLALAIARPFLPTRMDISWGAVLSAGLLAVLLIAMATAMWQQKAWRWLMLGVAALLLGGAAAATAHELSAQQQRWARSDDGQDIVIVVDTSMSMSLAADGKTSFELAVDEARGLIRAARPSDAMSVVLASATCRPVLPAPSSDRDELLSSLEGLTPSTSSLKPLEAIHAAIGILEKGHNSAKKIVIITDGQAMGWDVSSASRWQFLAGALASKQLPTRPQVICRTLPPVRAYTNLAIEDMTFSRDLVAVGRPCRLDVKVANTGAVPASGTTVVELVLDDRVWDQTANLGELQSNSSQTVQFDILFDRPGRHTVTARLKRQDDLPGDSQASRVLDVIDRLGVLVVDGAPSRMPMKGAADRIEIALCGGVRKPATGPDAPAAAWLEPTVVAVEATGELTDLSPYSVVVLANVPQLPARFANTIARFVQDGGGLLIAPGDRADDGFYAGWKTASGQEVCPARLTPAQGGATTRGDGGGRTAWQPAIGMDIGTFSHPALAFMADSSQSDAGSCRISSCWRLSPAAGSRTWGLLATQLPMLVDRNLGKGCVMVSAMAFDERDSNIAMLNCFVPMLHEIIYYLAGPSVGSHNHPPGSELSVDLSGGLVGSRAVAGAAPPNSAGQAAQWLTPDGQPIERPITGAGAARRVTLPGAADIGLYHVKLPGEWYAYMGLDANRDRGVPVAVVAGAGEGRMDLLTESDYARLGSHLNLVRVQTADELVAAVTGGMPGQEFWKYLVLGAIAALFCEVVLGRWIARRRRLAGAESVVFETSSKRQTATPTPKARREAKQTADIKATN